MRETWGTGEGLPQCSVSTVLQTRDNFLWAGTHGGLARFDGECFEVFGATTPGLGASRITSLFETEAGALWIGTIRHGLVRYEHGVFERAEVERGWELNYVTSMVEAPNGDLWVGADGLFRLPGGDPTTAELELVSIDSAGPIRQVHTVLMTKSGDLLVATDRGLLRRRGGEFQLLIEDQEQDFQGLVEDGAGRVWGFGGPLELFALDGDLTRFPQSADAFPDAPGGSYVTDAVLGPEGRVLMVGDDKLWQLNFETTTEGMVHAARLEPAANLAGKGPALSVGTDRDGQVWVGSGSHGLVCLARSSFRVLATNRPESPGVWSLFGDGGDGVIAHLMGSGLLRADRHLRFDVLPFGSPAFTPVVMDRAGTWWFANGSTLLNTIASGGVLDRVDLDLPPVQRLVISDDNAVWIGCTGALARYAEGELTELPYAGRRPIHKVISASADQAWLLSDEALMEWDGERVVELGATCELPDAELRDMHLAPDGSIWITTYGRGLARLRDGQVDCYDQRNGLLDDHLGAFLLSEDGRSYINSNRGVLVLSTEDIEAFDRGELSDIPCRLLRTGEGNGTQGCSTPDGLLWFPTMSGLAVVDPRRDTDDVRAPSVMIETVSVDGREQAAGIALDLPPCEGNLEFRYVAASFRELGGVRYRYQLTGYDDDWADVGSSRAAIYRGLKPGRYDFRIMAKSGASGWGDVLSVPVRLRPAFHQHWWFPGIVGLSLLLLAFALHWARMKTLREHTVALQAEIRERRAAEEERQRAEEQLRESTKLEAVGRLAGGIAHDFNNVLTAILGHVELMKARSLILSPEDILSHADTIESCSLKAGSLTQQLLAFSRRQVLRPRVIDVNGIVLGLEKLLTHLLPDAIELRIQTSPETGFVKADPSQLEQVVMNLVLNARDAMPKGGELLVQTRREGVVVEGLVLQHAVIAVEDSGRGIHPDDLPHVFEPFFTTKGPGGTGLGLASVHGIVVQSGGRVMVESELGQGANFRVLLPSVEGATPSVPAELAPAPEHRGSETVLVCDDYDPIRSVTRRTLEAYGYTVLVADHPERALEIARREERLSLLITDFAMPGMTGRELADRMLFEHPTLKVVFISGYTTNVAMRHQVVAEEVAFLEKPFTPEDLARKVRQVLDGRRAARVD